MTDTAAHTDTARWGTDDERGALNLLDPETVLAATQVCKTGVVYNLGLPVQRSGVPVFEYRGAPQRLTLTGPGESDMFVRVGGPVGLGANEDTLVIAAHNGTHMDALSHVYDEGEMYNGFPADSFRASSGAGRCGIEKTGGFAARAVLLDMARHFGVDWLEPGQEISADELEQCRAAQGSEIRRGDAVLVRTGWLDYYGSFAPGEPQNVHTQPGVAGSAASFFIDHDVCAVGADNAAVESVNIASGKFVELHLRLLKERGITFLEHLVLANMAADGCHEALLIAAPLLVTGGSGSPVNPIAIG